MATDARPPADPFAQAIRAGAQAEYCPEVATRAEPLSGPYANWDDFRSNAPAVRRALLELAMRPLPDLRGMPRERLPADLSGVADALGVPLASLTLCDRRWPGPVAAGVVYGAILWAGCPIVGFLAMYSSGAALAAVIGMISVLIGWSCVVCRHRNARGMGRRAHLARPHGDVHLWLFENGLLWRHGLAVAACPWEDVEDFQASHEPGRPHYVVAPRLAMALSLSLEDSPAIMALAEYMETKIASAQLLPRLQRIVAGERLRFGAVALDRHGCAGPGFAEAWSNVIRMMADRDVISFEFRGRPEWQQVRSQSVSHPRLMAVIAHILTTEAERLPPPSVEHCPLT